MDPNRTDADPTGGASSDAASPDTFGDTGLRASFRGPYADGPPPEDLEVHYPDLDRFGPAEAWSAVLNSLLLLGYVLKGLARKLVQWRRGSWLWCASEGMVEGFFAMGPTWVKLGQVVASSPGLFPDDMSGPAQRCLSDVPGFSFELVRQTITRDLGHDPSVLFRHIDERPLSAASVGQVHAVELPDGTEAVVKLLRPGIHERMNRDLRVAHVLAKLLMRTDLGRRANTAGMIRDLHRVTNQELNTALEAYRQHEFRENLHAFGDNWNVTGPEVIWEYCGPHMICMERVVGVPMDDFEAHQEMGFDAEANLRRGMKAWVEAMAVHGPFHGDLHAGNIWALEDGRACFLDFGIMGEFSADWQQMVRDILYTFMVDHDFARIVRGYKKLGIIRGDLGDDEQLGAMLAMVFEPIMASRMEELQFADLFQQSLQLSEQMGDISAPEELNLLGKQFLYFERYVKGIAPDYQMVRDPFIIKNLFPEEAARLMDDVRTQEPAMPVDPDEDL
ncbi:MAG: AarF/ABC1/UbiB kinase family protein [Microthrixaceae bacterium]|nr:AarF/ABC1/UbiB kinase family protein [Microthrixaceae bacterium]